MPDSNSSSRSKGLTCLVIGSIPVMLLLLLVAAFLINNRPPSITVPTPKMPKDNGWDYFIRACKMLDPAHRCPMSDASRKPEEWTIPELETFVKANEPALAVLREGLDKDFLMPPMRDLASVAGPYEHFAEMREMARTFSGEALYYRRLGRNAQAVNAHIDAVEMGVTLPRGGPVIAVLVGTAIEAIGEHGIHEVISRLNARELAQVARRLEMIQSKRTPLGENTIEDPRSSLAVGIRMFSGRDRLKYAWNAQPWTTTWFDDDEPRTVRYLRNAKFAFTNKQRMLRQIDDYSREMAAECNQPFQERSRVPVPNNPICELLAQYYRNVHHTYCRSQARLTLIEFYVALRRHHLDTGRYPAKLADLSPKYLKQIPADPFGGKALRYRLVDNGKSYLLYSIGPNLKDDGGKPGECRDANLAEDLVAGKF